MGKRGSLSSPYRNLLPFYFNFLVMKKNIFSFLALFTAFFFLSAPLAVAGSNPCNPCGMKSNPCNPCGMKHNPCNPCGMKSNPCNPCGMKHNPCNPCGMKSNPCNPCGANANPCSSSSIKRIRHAQVQDMKALIARGKKLWNDSSLSSNGLNCMSCHMENRLLHFDKNKGVFPHYVKMPNDIVSFDQMVNFCLINPMASKQINPNGVDMTAFGAYYQSLANPKTYGK